MDKVKKQAYSLIVLGIILLTISFVIGVIFDNSSFPGYMTGEQMILEILYFGLSFAAFIVIIVAIFMLIKFKETKPNEKSI